MALVSQRTNSGGGPIYQENIGDTTAQTRFESVSKHSNDSLLTRGNILQSDEDSMKLDELKALCTTLKNRVLDLEKTTTTQRNEIESLKRRVKKHGKRNSSRTHKLKRLYKVGLTAKEKSSSDEETGEEMFVAWQNENVIEEVVDVAQVSTVATTVTITAEEITLAQALKALKTSKPKVKGIIFQETELVKGKEKRTGTKLEQEITKKEKVDGDKEKTELKQLMETIPNEEEVAIDAIPLAVKSPRIID
nr:hypothetical protein [Tanacetum cinerariifolium]